MALKDGLHLITPTSISYDGGTATIGTNGTVSFTSGLKDLQLNGVFSADYDDYIVLYFAYRSTNAQRARIRFTSNGTPDSSASYDDQRLTSYYYSGTNVVLTRVLNQTSGFMFQSALPPGVFSRVHIYGPHLNQPTVYRTFNRSHDGTIDEMHDTATVHGVSASYDGINLIGSGNFFSRGRIAVYGMRK